MTKNKIVDFSDAERNARLRDIENSKILTDEEMQQANDLQAKANSRGMKLIPEKRVKNKAEFVQFIQKNWKYLNEIKYLTTGEKAFLLDIMPYIGFLSNALVENPSGKPQMPLTQEALGLKIGKNKSQMSKIVNPLVDKGILERTAGAIENNNTKAFVIYVNPHIMYSGDRDNINPTLQTMFQRYMNKKVFKNLPIRFF
ncbi:MarR family transcriptional regulator [Bacillus cereus]|uniref:MarR family transcriptional regulator n=1 Tax=Bacillus cereus TaxID=1396 RepID=UPI001443B434|nr:MarR family transcriptional regulator [Bacillus cereus]NKX03297.1 MarR family transcriptional regulator [Bacillus cereus]